MLSSTIVVLIRLRTFNYLQEKAVTKEGLIKARGGKHEKDDRPEIRGKEHYVLGWDNKEKIAHAAGGSTPVAAG